MPEAASAVAKASLKKKPQKKRLTERPSARSSSAGGNLSLGPLWAFLALGAAVLAWRAMAPLQTARERGQAEL
jgi:hypothetical protein